MSQYFKQLTLWFLLASWLMPAIAVAAVTATVDRNPVMQGETVTLTIRVADENGEPDLGVLGSEFRVLGQSTSSQVQYINGNVSKWKDWNIQLLPTRAGRLTIPAIPVGQTASNPIVLTVAKQSANASKEAWIEFSVAPKTAWQGQQILVNVALYYANSVRSGELTVPELSNGIIEQVGEDQTEQTVKNGVRYNRLTRRYVVFPEQAGDFVIRGPVFTGQAEAGRQQGGPFGGLFRNTRHVSAAADDAVVDVKRLVPGSDFWLPAEDVALSASWGEEPSVPVFRVGEPVTRVVTLTAYGLLATQLPDLELNYPGLRAYPEAAEQETRGSAQGVVGVRHYRTAIIPQVAGRVMLPEQRVKWWDVARGEWAEAVLPAEEIEVLPAANAVTAVSPNQAEPEPCEPVLLPQISEAPVPNDDAPMQCDESVTIPSDDSRYWRYVAFGLAGLWVFTLALWFWFARRERDSSLNAANPPSAIPKLKAQLLSDCKGNNRDAAISSLARLAAAAGLSAHAPAAVAAVVPGQALKEALQDLDAAKYGQKSSWNGTALAAALTASDWPSEGVATSGEALPKLYP